MNEAKAGHKHDYVYTQCHFILNVIVSLNIFYQRSFLGDPVLTSVHEKSAASQCCFLSCKLLRRK